MAEDERKPGVLAAGATGTLGGTVPANVYNLNFADAYDLGYQDNTASNRVDDEAGLRPHYDLGYQGAPEPHQYLSVSNL